MTLGTRVRAAGFLFFVSIAAISSFARAEDLIERDRNGNNDSQYPMEPNESVTPGEVCNQPDEYRYPEHIAYCTRSVSSAVKAQIIRYYDEHFGYTIGTMNRQDFKIDHFIPLCMGGANTVKNLWPQHKSVYVHTDPLEAKLCELMAQGKMTQSEAISTIKDVKHNLERAESVMRELTQRN